MPCITSTKCFKPTNSNGAVLGKIHIFHQEPPAYTKTGGGGDLLATNTFIQVYVQVRSDQREIRTVEIISRHGNKIKTWILHSTAHQHSQVHYRFHFILLAQSVSALFLALSLHSSLYHWSIQGKISIYSFVWLTMWKMSDINIRISKES